MSKFKWDNYRDCGTHMMAVFDLKYDGKKICEYVSWAFTSCAIDAFQRLSYVAYADVNPFNDKKIFEKLIEFLRTKCPDNKHTTWKPQEFYFCVDSGQLHYLKALTSHPKVRRVDKFTNKAHGPNDMHLFRLSIQEDFKRFTRKLK